jgi:hypothetical protein
MLGYHISVYRQIDGGSSPATKTSPEGRRIAVWQTGLGGLEWLNKLTSEGHAIAFPGGGYPDRYTAQARHIIPQLLGGPPDARPVWGYGANDVLSDKWAGKTVIEREAAEACSADEWLLIEAWDES